MEGTELLKAVKESGFSLQMGVAAARSNRVTVDISETFRFKRNCNRLSFDDT